MPDSQRRASSAVTGSGANAGSTGSEARAACSSPVTRPSSVMSRIRGSSGLARQVSRASEGREASESTARPSARRTWRQPSPSLSTKPCSTETVAVSPSAAAWSIHPTSRGTCGKPRAVRNWVISTSGLTPGRGRLRDFRISSRPSAIEVLLCSPESRCTSIAVASRPPGAAQGIIGRPRKLPARPVISRPALIASSIFIPNAGSAWPSTTTRDPTRAIASPSSADADTASGR